MASIPAASVILVRDRPDGPPQLLMAERSSALAFAGGALVFPGGRVDSVDLVVARDARAALGMEGLEDEDAAARIACVRELLEETGLLLSDGVAPQPDAIASARAMLAEGPEQYESCTYAAILMAMAHRVDGARLHPFAIWEPPAAAPIKRRFHTRFYIADAAGIDLQALSPDGHEAVAVHWMTGEEALAAGVDRLVFPTRCILARLGQYASAAEMIGAAKRFGAAYVQPRIVDRDGQTWITIPEGMDYPLTGEPLTAVRRE